MPILRFIVRAFIDVFGITHPTPRQERTAALFIGALLALIVAAMAVIVILIYKLGSRSL